MIEGALPDRPVAVEQKLSPERGSLKVLSQHTGLSVPPEKTTECAADATGENVLDMSSNRNLRSIRPGDLLVKIIRPDGSALEHSRKNSMINGRLLSSPPASLWPGKLCMIVCRIFDAESLSANITTFKFDSFDWLTNSLIVKTNLPSVILPEMQAMHADRLANTSVAC